MAKNIVLFSDGTGNKGGTGSDTNVFKLYHAIKTLKLADTESTEIMRVQRCFYDNGVGTSSISLLQAIGGASGAGFRANVRDLYEFTCRHYEQGNDNEDGDDIYGFGFSRGAATIRAFAGMVDCCGLVKKQDDEEKFQEEIDLAMRQYVRSGGRTSLIGIIRSIFNLKDRPEDRIDDVKIEFLGVWDTVAALGFPQLPWLDNVVNFFRRHNFYNYSPTDTVINVAQALAIDDERRTFWPLVWDETQGKGTSVNQVWFPGVHSNVGGGYPRAGIANTTLDWMISRLIEHRESKIAEGSGLKLETAFEKDVANGVNHYGKAYDSRGGFALSYRYQPRPITELCSKKCESINIHESVISRMRLRTAGYGPSQLPGKFNLVYENNSPYNEALPVDLNKSDSSAWTDIRNEIDNTINSRIGLYWSFLSATLLLIFVSMFFWIGDIVFGGYGEQFRSGSPTNALLGHTADILNYFLPDIFKNIINYSVLKNPSSFLIFLAVAGLFYFLRKLFKSRSDKACEKGRAYVLDQIPDLPGGGGSVP